ncbi:ATP-binding cassette domain-containing protein [Vibrio hibernica]|uniref:ABC transporter ATP-binding protein n=1 Tax=Vibrio hibernica TaxID=2587465 RepID=UPI0039B06ED3
MPPLQAHNLTMKFKDKMLFHIPKLQLMPNEAVYLRGDNGVGKTTLLKILSGLLQPTSGQLNCQQSRLSRWLSPNKHRIVYLHQSPYLFDNTVFNNVLYAIRFSSYSHIEKRAQVISALRKVGLETLAKEHVSVLSGGEKQRIAMARAWVTKPNILLMDEPSSSLDIESISRLHILAKELLENGASVVITSHQQNELTQLCTKQWWIKNHTLVESPVLQVIQASPPQQPFIQTDFV